MWSLLRGVQRSARHPELRDSGDQVVDSVGRGSGAAIYEGSPYPKVPGERYSLERYVPGYDTDNNRNDFTTRYPPTPRNSGL